MTDSGPVQGGREEEWGTGRDAVVGIGGTDLTGERETSVAEVAADADDDGLEE